MANREMEVVILAWNRPPACFPGKTHQNEGMVGAYFGRPSHVGTLLCYHFEITCNAISYCDQRLKGVARRDEAFYLKNGDSTQRNGTQRTVAKVMRRIIPDKQT